ncbi:hypothetical protein V501_03937 [Pseudogymnoascus sp. VKM F-4519 (FW-2642)]|nr:hypothetical protein V501_03937 [Pseudogymnoascus sp. VKM F-4519 (FW-2642)]
MGLQGVVKTAYIFKKREGTTDEEFSKRFIEHGKQIVPFMLKYNVIKYNQQHILATHKTAFVEALGPSKFLEADAIITIVFPSMESLKEFYSDPERPNVGAEILENGSFESASMTVGDEYSLIAEGQLLI